MSCCECCCNAVGGECCGEPGSKTCCKDDRVCCNKVCCQPEHYCCKEAICCPNGRACCGTPEAAECCDEGATCCKGLICCDEGEVCCGTDLDPVCCPPGQCCYDGVCEPCDCESDEDCGEGECCNGGVCGPCDCEDDDDCGEGEWCCNATCQAAVSSFELLSTVTLPVGTASCEVFGGAGSYAGTCEAPPPAEGMPALECVCCCPDGYTPLDAENCPCLCVGDDPP